MKITAAMGLVALTFTITACQSEPEACNTSAIKQSSHVSAAECSCKLKAADKYLSSSDKAYLLEYWSGKRNDQPHIYLGRAYASGDNKPLIKYNAYVAKECRK